jgi:hypothetical protein
MFLSNRLAALLILLLVCSGLSCSWTSGTTPNNASQAIEPPKSGIPFETKEPEIFQADLITRTAGNESRVRYARKGANWRIDTFEGDTPSRSMIGGDKRLHLDHRSRTYSEAPSGGGPTDRPTYVNDLTQSLLNRKERAKFEKLGADGNIERYRATVEGSSTPWIITYDTSIKMVTRQEPESPTTDSFLFEMRGFTLDVSDATFQIPSGYRKVEWTEFSKDR